MFESLISGTEDRNRRFTVYRSGDDTDVESRLERHGIQIEHAEHPQTGAEPFLVVEEDDEFTGALPLSAFDALIDPPIVRPGLGEGVSRPYRVLFEALDDTCFDALERRQLLAVSREVEDRAFRVGSGQLHAGFQTLSVFRSQADVYRHLASETDLDIHVYGRDDWDPPEIPGISYHTPTDEGFERYWVLAFDGGETDSQACGLIARENENDYDGFWTDDPAVVENILAVLTERE